MVVFWVTAVEIVGLVSCLVVGLWSSLFAYDIVPERIYGRFRWNGRFKKHLKWLGPVVTVMSLVALFL